MNNLHSVGVFVLKYIYILYIYIYIYSLCIIISEILFTLFAHCRREKSDRLTESLSDVSKLIIIKL